MTIHRYTKPEMGRIWSEEERVRIWCQVELAAARAQGAPIDVLRELSDPASWPHPTDCDELEKVTRHEVTAFLQSWRCVLSVEAGRWLHLNMTSSDLTDSALGRRLDRSFWAIDSVLSDLTAMTAQHAIDHRATVRVGRTHGQHAELTTWGYRVAGFAYALDRARQRFVFAQRWFPAGKLSGPVGDHKRVTLAQETEFLRELGLRGYPVTTQIVPRDGIADFVWACAQIVTAVEDMAMEVRLSQRSEVGELAESFASGQHGSSAMPHKRNPITAERLCGLARLVQSRITPVLEGVTQHHERDLVHSSVERVALPEVAILTHFVLDAACDLWSGLQVNVERMRFHAQHAADVALSARVKDSLIEVGVPADVAWVLVSNAAAAYAQGENLIEAVTKSMADDWAPQLDAVDWAPLHAASTEPLLQLTGDTDPVFEDLIGLT